MKLENKIKRVLMDFDVNEITLQEATNRILNLLGVIGGISFKEIEMLVQLKHSDDWEYGNDEKRCAELIEATRNKIGYTKDDVYNLIKSIDDEYRS